MARDNEEETPSWMNEGNATSEGLEEISIDIETEGESEGETEGENDGLGGEQGLEENDDMDSEQGVEEMFNEPGDHFDFDSENGATTASVQDILRLDLKTLTPHDLRNVEFVSLDMAYWFYYWFAKVNGFAFRKSKLLKNNKGQKLQQLFVCYIQGFREDRGLTKEKRKREPKPETRCGCEARMKVHIDMNSSRWYITYFLDEHTHALNEEKYSGKLASHRGLSETEVMQMNKILLQSTLP